MAATQKTHKTAVVLIPPEEVWEPIQAIRRTHDRQVRRWMPHITLIYPFRPAEGFKDVVAPLSEQCGNIDPFEVELAELRYFTHGRKGFTMWLCPSPAERLRQLQTALQTVTPDCDEVQRHSRGFTAHLSVGQVRHRRQLEQLLAELRGRWEPIRFVARAISLIQRNDPPDDVFRVAHTIPLGG